MALDVPPNSRSEVCLHFPSFDRFRFATFQRCIFGRKQEEKSIVHNSIADDNAIREECFDWKIAQKENWKQQWRNSSELINYLAMTMVIKFSSPNVGVTRRCVNMELRKLKYCKKKSLLLDVFRATCASFSSEVLQHNRQRKLHYKHLYRKVIGLRKKLSQMR